MSDLELAVLSGVRLDLAAFKRRFDEIVANVNVAVRDKDEVVRLALTAVLCEGHVLFEDVPGTGKSVLARGVGHSIAAIQGRIQCTPDMLPGDITGSSIMDPRTGALEFRRGPIFANVLVVDEINRATPKTQSALLEGMEERVVSADGVTNRLPRPFIVFATQNSLEKVGTFPLPEAQLDRFMFKLSMGYLSVDSEIDVAFANARSLAVERIGPVVNTDQVDEMIEFATTIRVNPEVATYIASIVEKTRTDPAVAVGGSPRASIALLRGARVLAAADGRDWVFPDDVRTLIRPVLSHRLVLGPQAILRGETIDDVIERVSESVPIPMNLGSRGAARWRR